MPSIVAGSGYLQSNARTPKGSATRAQLIEATISCLAERGYAGTSTAAICTEAQLTAGALFGHYPNKLALLADTVQTLVRQTVDELSPVIDAATRAAQAAAKRGRPVSGRPRRTARLPGDLASGIDNIPAMFRRPTLQALLELRVAARTEPLLARGFANGVEAFERLGREGGSGEVMGREAARVVVMMMHSLWRFIEGSAITVASLRAAGSTSEVQWEERAFIIEARRLCEFWLGEIAERAVLP
jgi:AcrR family transcriptional regulator